MALLSKAGIKFFNLMKLLHVLFNIINTTSQIFIAFIKFLVLKV